jgi:hypothetical protein
MAYKKKTPRGDATPIKKMDGEYQPYPYGPVQKQAKKVDKDAFNSNFKKQA